MERSPVFSCIAMAAACVLGLLLSLGSSTLDAKDRPGRSYSHGQAQKAALGRMRQDTRARSHRAARNGLESPDKSSNRPVIERTENGYTREQTVTNGKGETSTRSTVVVRDPGTGTYSKSTTFTGFDGRTHGKTVETEKTDTSYSRTKEITHQNGSVTTQQASATYDPVTRKWSRDVDVSHTKPTAPGDSKDDAPEPGGTR